MQFLVVLRTRQRREAEEFENVDRQFLFDDVDIAGNRLGRVGRKAENIAGVGDDAVAPPSEQHFAVFPDLVLPLLGPHQRFRIDVFQSDEDEGAAGPSRLLDEMRNAMTKRVDLQDQPDLEVLTFTQFDQAVEDRFPVAVAGEVIVSNEKPRDALRGIGAYDRLDVVGGAVTRFAALDIDDRAEAALKRTAAASVEAGI